MNTNSMAQRDEFVASDIEQIATILDLKRSGNEWHGANPFNDNGASEDGFILYPEGNAFDRKTGDKYPRGEVAKRAGYGSNPVPRVLPARPALKPTAKPFDWKAATKFDYVDESGALLFQVGRLDNEAGKKILQRMPDPENPDAWLYKLDGARRVL